MATKFLSLLLDWLQTVFAIISLPTPDSPIINTGVSEGAILAIIDFILSISWLLLIYSVTSIFLDDPFFAIFRSLETSLPVRIPPLNVESLSMIGIAVYEITLPSGYTISLYTFSFFSIISMMIGFSTKSMPTNSFIFFLSTSFLLKGRSSSHIAFIFLRVPFSSNKTTISSICSITFDIRSSSISNLLKIYR